MLFTQLVKLEILILTFPIQIMILSKSSEH